jgi:hypothetical protein
MLIWYLNASFDPDQSLRHSSRLFPGAAAIMTAAGAAAAAAPMRVRPVTARDLAQVISIDTEVTGIEKTDYWYELFHRYGTGRTDRKSVV